MKEFLEVAKDLQITEIKDVPEENTLIEENVNGTSLEDESSDDINCENEKGRSTDIDTDIETSPHVSSPSTSTKCPQCDVVFAQRYSMLEHIRGSEISL